MGGSRGGFDRALEAIEAKVIELFGIVAEDLPAVTQALLHGQGDMARALADREQVVDALYREVEELAGRQLLLQAPVASDLRFLLSVLRIAPELERSHDLVMQIASPVGHGLAGGLAPADRALAGRMGDLACIMWRQAADAWYARDRSAAHALAGQQAEMATLHARLIAELASGRMAIPAMMDMTLVAHCYERLGAHAVNIARRVTYLAGRRLRASASMSGSCCSGWPALTPRTAWPCFMFQDPAKFPRLVRRRPARRPDRRPGRVHGRLAGPLGHGRRRWDGHRPRLADQAELVHGRRRRPGDPPATQRAMSQRAGSTVVEVPVSHAVYITQPAPVADFIKQAVSAVAARQ